MKTKLLSGATLLLAFAVRSQNNLTFNSLIANYGYPHPITWETSNWSSGFGHKIYNDDNNGRTYWRVAGRHNSATWSDMFSISSDAKIGLGMSEPTHGLILKYVENNTTLGANVAAALRICNPYYNNFGRRAELQLGTDENMSGLLAVVAGEYSDWNPGLGGDLVLGTKPKTSNVIERVRITHAGSFLLKKYDGTINFKVNELGVVDCRQVNIHTNQIFPDYVFKEGYALLSLPEVEKYITGNHRLPGFLPAEEYEQNGIDAGSMIIKQQEKIEELTLHLIEINKQVKALQHQIDSLTSQKPSSK